MNNIRLNDSYPRAWLEVTIKKEDHHGYTVASTYFDGTPFSIHVPKLKVEVNKDDKTKGLLEVGRVGNGFGYVEVVLPAPELRFGHSARVLTTQIVTATPTVTTGTKYKK
jgi:hypothetical protein